MLLLMVAESLFWTYIIVVSIVVVDEIWTVDIFVDISIKEPRLPLWKLVTVLCHQFVIIKLFN